MCPLPRLTLQAQEISSKAYSGPQVASKYTYDNGDAPFSSSWTSPSNAPRPPAAKDRKKSGKANGFPSTPAMASPSTAGRNENIRSQTAETAADAGARPSPSSSSSSSDGGRVKPAAKPAAAATAVPSKSDRTAGAFSREGVAARATAAAGPAPSGAASVPVAAAVDARTGDGRKEAVSPRIPPSPANQSSTSGGSDSKRVPAIASRVVKTTAAGRDQGRGAERSSLGGGGAQGTGSGEEALRKLSLEVSELRTMLVINRSALARVENMGGPAAAAVGAAAAPEGKGAAAAAPSAVGGEANRDEERRDNAVRKLTRDVAELRAELSAVADELSGAATPGGRGGDTEVIQTMRREVLELRSQLENVRKEAALTRSALRRLQGDFDSLKQGAARPKKGEVK